MPCCNVTDLGYSEKVRDYDYKPEYNKCQRNQEMKQVLAQMSLILEEKG